MMSNAIMVVTVTDLGASHDAHHRESTAGVLINEYNES